MPRDTDLSAESPWQRLLPDDPPTSPISSPADAVASAAAHRPGSGSSSGCNRCRSPASCQCALVSRVRPAVMSFVFLSSGAAGVPPDRVRVGDRPFSVADVRPCERARRMRCARGVCALDRPRESRACARAALEAGRRRMGIGRWPAGSLTRDAPSTSERPRSGPRHGSSQAGAHPSSDRLREFADVAAKWRRRAPEGFRSGTGLRSSRRALRPGESGALLRLESVATGKT